MSDAAAAAAERGRSSDWAGSCGPMLSLLLLRAAAGSGVSVPPNHGDRPHIVFFMVRRAMHASHCRPLPAGVYLISL
jgi:hypothetical protein